MLCMLQMGLRKAEANAALELALGCGCMVLTLRVRRVIWQLLPIK